MSAAHVDLYCDHCGHRVAGATAWPERLTIEPVKRQSRRAAGSFGGLGGKVRTARGEMIPAPRTPPGVFGESLEGDHVRLDCTCHTKTWMPDRSLPGGGRWKTRTFTGIPRSKIEAAVRLAARSGAVGIYLNSEGPVEVRWPNGRAVAVRRDPSRARSVREGSGKAWQPVATRGS